MNKLNSQTLRHSLALATLGLIGAGANAAGPDFTAITSAVDFSTVVTGVLAVAAAVALVYIAISGAKKLLGMIRGA